MRLVSIDRLRPHERTDRWRLDRLKRRICRDGKIKAPIIVDENTSIILDGHHRVACLKSMSLSKVPALMVDYGCGDISVSSRRKSLAIGKKDVIKAGLSGNLLPPKSSRHFHALDARCLVPLSLLK